LPTGATGSSSCGIRRRDGDLSELRDAVEFAEWYPAGRFQAAQAFLEQVADARDLDGAARGGTDFTLGFE